MKIKNQWFVGLFAFLALAACDDGDEVKVVENTTVTVTTTVTIVWGHEGVDLGLPSGILWATSNVGASLPADYGDYFAWGETAPKSAYSWDAYKWCGSTFGDLTKYNTDESLGAVDNKTVLDAADDAATANWGNSWRMPTPEEVEELLNKDNCTWTWAQKINSKGESIGGYEVTSKVNGATIFLPAAGGRGNTGDAYEVASDGYYLTSSLKPDSPTWVYILDYYMGKTSLGVGCRNSGYSVRPVCTPSAN